MGCEQSKEKNSSIPVKGRFSLAQADPPSSSCQSLHANHALPPTATAADQIARVPRISKNSKNKARIFCDAPAWPRQARARQTSPRSVGSVRGRGRPESARDTCRSTRQWRAALPRQVRRKGGHRRVGPHGRWLQNPFGETVGRGAAALGRGGTQRCARVRAPRGAFRCDKSIGVPTDNFAALSLAYAFPCRRFVSGLAAEKTCLGASADRYSFTTWICATYSLPVSRRTVAAIPSSRLRLNGSSDDVTIGAGSNLALYGSANSVTATTGDGVWVRWSP